MKKRLLSFLRDDRGAALAEYALLLVAFFVLMLGVMALVGSESAAQLSGTQTRLTNASTLSNGSTL